MIIGKRGTVEVTQESMIVGNDRYPYSLLNDSLSTISEALWALPQKLAVPRPQKLELDCRAHYWSRESQGCRLREPVYRWTVNGLRLPGRDCERPPVPFESDPISNELQHSDHNFARGSLCAQQHLFYVFRRFVEVEVGGNSISVVVATWRIHGREFAQLRSSNFALAREFTSWRAKLV